MYYTKSSAYLFIKEVRCNYTKLCTFFSMIIACIMLFLQDIDNYILLANEIKDVRDKKNSKLEELDKELEKLKNDMENPKKINEKAKKIKQTLEDLDVLDDMDDLSKQYPNYKENLKQTKKYYKEKLSNDISEKDADIAKKDLDAVLRLEKDYNESTSNASDIIESTLNWLDEID